MGLCMLGSVGLLVLGLGMFVWRRQVWSERLAASERRVERLMIERMRHAQRATRLAEAEHRLAALVAERALRDGEPEDEAFLKQVHRQVEAHLGDASFGVRELAEGLYMSPRQLQRKIRHLTGQSPVVFLRTLRLQRAAHLLQREEVTVSEVAYAVGFSNRSYFAKCFRAHYGQAPSEYAV